MATDTIIVVSTILSGLLAYSYQVFAATMADRRAQDLDRLAKQLEEFYGPVLSLATSTWRIFKLFAETHTDCEYPTQMQQIIARVKNDHHVRAEYVRWMRQALLPLHRRAATIIDTKAHLFEEDCMNYELMEYVAMVRSYEVIEHKWSQGDFTTLFSPLRYPPGILNHVDVTFKKLRARQAMLLSMPVDPLARACHVVVSGCCRPWRLRRHNTPVKRRYVAPAASSDYEKHVADSQR